MSDVPCGDFITKDSGERQQWPSGMQRDVQTDKVRYDLVFDGPILERWAALLTRGAVKYEARNWMKAESEEELQRFRQSAIRHFVQWVRGDVDEDHAAAVMFNLNGAEFVKARIASTVGAVRAHLSTQRQMLEEYLRAKSVDVDALNEKCFRDLNDMVIKMEGDKV